ncbi:HopJ type III effector protein [Cellulophaga sp. Hel_I_12]|uniref:HopJ type III effector protein n=1 Tax=Cellulophaga sp. Hel_I_12 TaxID=1249972 RepID=UPI00064810F8|nr:HopJ type III effector protein [Cellulophaga sp. Hel_I_12]
MTLQDFKNKLQQTPEKVEFLDTMAVIEANYEFTPTAFSNGTLHNASGENSGSCKLFSFAQKQGFSKEETLACFGQYYFDAVVNNPKGTDHQNIRNFIKTGFDQLTFDSEVLIEK